MVRFGTFRPEPFTGPVAGSPRMGAFEKLPGRDPSGRGPFSFAAGSRLAIAISTFAFPALATGPGGAFDGGAAPAERVGAPTPWGSAICIFGVPRIEGSGDGLSMVGTGVVKRASRATGGGGTRAFRRFIACTPSA